MLSYGISETIQPEWQNFKYVGSPFNTYRYNGVERSIKFEIKPSAIDADSKENLRKNSLDLLPKSGIVFNLCVEHYFKKEE